MPTTPYAKLLIRVNGGAPQSGGITAATGDVIQLEAESTVGWSSASRWEISGFPSGFALPAGWLSETAGGHTVYYYLGNTPPPAFTLGPWGKYMPALHVNGGGGQKTDVSTAISVPSPSGLIDLGHDELEQFGRREGWAKDQRANLRVLEAGLGGGGGAPDISAIQTSNYAASINEIVRVAANDPITVTLPSAAGNAGHSVWVKEVDEGPESITVQATGGQAIDGGTTYVFAGSYAVRHFVSDGSNWMVL